jgi:TonB family protein
LTTAAAGIGLAYGLRTPPRLRLAEEPAVLGTFGITRATILLPAAACDWPADRIHIVLAHELAHVRRGDWLVQTLAELVRAVYWFNPLIWLACRRLRLESEQACDDVVLTLGVESSAYAAELVDLALAFHARRRPLVPAAAIARPSHLERRIRAMLNATINRDPITRSASIAAAVVLAALTVLIAGFGVSAQAQFGSVAGTVSDQHGRAIGGVTLVLANPTAQTKHEVKTDPAGHYEIVGVPTGTYELTFQMPGMSTLKREGLTVASAPVQVNAVMQIGSIVETITVNSTADTAPLVRGSSGPTPAAKPDACATSANGGCIRPPVKIKDVRPVFPPGASVDPPGTVVILSARIDANGYVTDVQVLRAIDPVLAASAIEAVRLWEYLPTQLDGQPIDARMTVLVNFTK